MSSPTIDSVAKLQDYLHHAMRIEHATLPPYLLALYSILPGTNLDAVEVIRVVVVEEMLHLTLAANLLNAIGGKPDLLAPDFVPLYPAYLPDGEDDFQVNLISFSPEAVETFLKIERPLQACSAQTRLVQRRKDKQSTLAFAPHDDTLRYYSIGEFYAEILRGFEYLSSQLGQELFCGDPARQITPEKYYSGGGKLNTVQSRESAQVAIRQIIEQGEGFGGGIYDQEDHELAHLYRFQELQLGRHYRKGDQPGQPSGPSFQVEWDAVLPLKRNARLTDYSEGSELYEAAVAFNQSYANFLALLNAAFNGKPELLLEEAVPYMFTIKYKILQLVNNPIPGMECVNAAPTFELAKIVAEVTA